MASDFPVRSQLPEDRRIRLLLSGGNGAALTVEEGSGCGVTVPRSGEGAYTLTLPFNPGVFKGWGFGFGAATPADVKGHTVVRDTPTAWDGETWELPFVVYDSTFTADDLLVNEYLDIELVFGLSED